MNTSIRVALILMLALFTAYAHAATRSPEDTQLARLAGAWQIVTHIADERISYAASASYSVARRYLRFDLTRDAAQPGPPVTWIFGFDAHSESFVCFEIGADDRTRGPLVTRFVEGTDGVVAVEIEGETPQSAPARFELHRA
jgi:hypothetical protein